MHITCGYWYNGENFENFYHFAQYVVEDERETYTHYYDVSQYDQTEKEDGSSRWEYSSQCIAEYGT